MSTVDHALANVDLADLAHVVRHPRAHFEVWAIEQGWDIRRDDGGAYLTASTEAAWGGWLGCLGHLSFLSHASPHHHGHPTHAESSQRHTASEPHNR